MNAYVAGGRVEGAGAPEGLLHLGGGRSLGRGLAVDTGTGDLHAVSPLLELGARVDPVPDRPEGHPGGKGWIGRARARFEAVPSLGPEDRIHHRSGMDAPG